MKVNFEFEDKDIKVNFENNYKLKDQTTEKGIKVLMLKGEKGDPGDGEANVIEKVQVNGTDLPVSNKTVNVPVPTIDSSISSSSTNPVQNNAIYNALSNKVDASALNNYYEISEIDDLLSNKANISIVDKKPYYFENVASMKAYNLKAGDYAITKGYYSSEDGGHGEYILVDDNTLVDDGGLIHELANGLKAKLILEDKGKLNIKKLGAYGDNTHDDTTVFENAISICKDNQINTLYIPKGIYKLTQNLLIDYPLNIEGEYSQYIGSYAKEVIGTILSDNYQGNNPFIKYEYNISDIAQSRIWGVKISNIQINGNSTSNHVGLYLKRTGWNGLVSNLYFRGYYHTALYLDRVLDTKFDNISIVECGSKISTEQNYALVVDDSSSVDTSNALHFDSLHIEGCRYVLKLDRSKNNTFVNCKFEDKINTNESDTVNSEIFITDNASENSFVGCQFIGIDSQTWINKGISISSVPYMINISFTSNRAKGILFSSCQFSSGSDRGTKYIKGNAYIQISNCAFRVCCNKYYSLDLAGANISNSTFVLNNNESGIANVSIINSRNLNLIDNCKFQYFGSSSTLRYAIDLGINASSINNCQYTDFTGNYKYTDQSSINFNMSYQQRNSGMLILTDTTYKNLMGLTDIDYTNIVLDVSKFTNKLVSLNFSQNATIKELKNGLNGDEISFINNTANTYTIGGDFDYHGTKIRGSADASTITIGNLGSCSISKFTNYWKVTSKN